VVASQEGWPAWWQWELDCSNPHLLKRMIDRSFNEVELREMLQQATAYRPDRQANRWIVETTYSGRTWEVVVEPDASAQTLVVVTAYAIG
jgi:hypothetical protein